MIYQALSTHPDLWSLYRESQAVIGTYFPAEMTPGSSVLVRGDDVDDGDGHRHPTRLLRGGRQRRGVAPDRGPPCPADRAVASEPGPHPVGIGPEGPRPSAWWRRRRTTASGSRCCSGSSPTPSSCTWCATRGGRSPRCTGVGPRRRASSGSSCRRGSPSRAIRARTGASGSRPDGRNWTDPRSWRSAPTSGGCTTSTAVVISRRIPTGSSPSATRTWSPTRARCSPSWPRGRNSIPCPLDRYSRKLPVVNTWSMPSADKWRKVEREAVRGAPPGRGRVPAPRLPGRLSGGGASDGHVDPRAVHRGRGPIGLDGAGAAHLDAAGHRARWAN